MLQMLWISRRCIRPYAGLTYSYYKFNRRRLPLRRSQLTQEPGVIYIPVSRLSQLRHGSASQFHRSLSREMSILQARSMNARTCTVHTCTCAEAYTLHPRCAWASVYTSHGLSTVQSETMHTRSARWDVNAYTLTWLLGSGLQECKSVE
jgi:hypothetical protein